MRVRRLSGRHRPANKSTTVGPLLVRGRKPALRDRPSRFDRTFHFDLPRKRERLAYLQMWNGALAPEMRLSQDELRRLARATRGFSFAYFKELVVSSMAAWFPSAEAGRMFSVMKAQRALLESQRSDQGQTHERRSSSRKALAGKR